MGRASPAPERESKEMTKKIAALGIAVLVVLGSQMLVEAHAGNVRRSDCTHRVSATGERHMHTGRPYCDRIAPGAFLSEAWMHH